MTLAVLMSWLAGGLAWPAAPSPPDLHVVFRSEFIYMSSTRVVAHEGWVSDGKSAVRQGDRLSINREDLGLTWRINAKAGTYTEVARPPAQPKAPRQSTAAPAVDMHTAGYDWEAQYDWTVKASGRTTTIVGRPCREFVANGDADFAEARVSFWACVPVPGVTRSPTDMVMGVLRSESTKGMILETLAAHGHAWLLGAEEQQEPAIAPTMVVRVRVESVEASTAPSGTFDLPPTLTKAGR